MKNKKFDFKKICTRISISLIVFFAILVLLIYLPNDKEKLFIDNKPTSKPIIVNIPSLVKITGLRQRELYYRKWISEIIAEGIPDGEGKIEKIAEWINNLPFTDELQKGLDMFYKESFREQFIIRNIDQHEYYTLIKQYGNPNDKGRIFCNLMAVVGYQASQIYINQPGKVIVRISKDRFSYYNFENKTKPGEELNKNSSEIFNLYSDEENKHDEAKCRDILNKSIGFFRKRFLGAEQNILGRRLRYEIFKRLCKKVDCEYCLKTFIDKDNKQ